MLGWKWDPRHSGPRRAVSGERRRAGARKRPPSRWTGACRLGWFGLRRLEEAGAGAEGGGRRAAGSAPVGLGRTPGGRRQGSWGRGTSRQPVSPGRAASHHRAGLCGAEQAAAGLGSGQPRTVRCSLGFRRGPRVPTAGRGRLCGGIASLRAPPRFSALSGFRSAMDLLSSAPDDRPTPLSESTFSASHSADSVHRARLCPQRHSPGCGRVGA